MRAEPLADIEVAFPLMAVVADNDEQLARGRDAMRPRLAFYGSTPAYKVILDVHGWGDLQPELNRLSKTGDWATMSSLITDEIVDAFSVQGTPDEIGAIVRERYGDLVQRISFDTSAQLDPDRARADCSPASARLGRGAAGAKASRSKVRSGSPVTSAHVTCTILQPAASIAANRLRSRFHASREPWCSNPSHSQATRAGRPREVEPEPADRILALGRRELALRGVGAPASPRVVIPALVRRTLHREQSSNPRRARPPPPAQLFGAPRQRGRARQPHPPRVLRTQLRALRHRAAPRNR